LLDLRVGSFLEEEEEEEEDLESYDHKISEYSKKRWPVSSLRVGYKFYTRDVSQVNSENLSHETN